MPDEDHLNVMIDPFDVEAAVREEPGTCAQLWWGKELRGVQVTLGRAAPAVVEALLEAAWRRRAPKRLLR